MVSLTGITSSYSVPQLRRQDRATPANTDKQDKPGKSDAASSRQSDPRLQQLQQRDRDVRAHEQAHLSASGGLATGGAQYTYQRGSDGKEYAIGGEVNIDTSPGKTPEETIRRTQTIRAAALAPADPSSQDRAVAADAEAMEAKARTELTQQTLSGAQSNTPNGNGNKIQQAYADSGKSSRPTIDTRA